MCPPAMAGTGKRVVVKAPVGCDEVCALRVGDGVATQPRTSCSKRGDQRLYPEMGSPCWTLAIRVWLRAWGKMVPTLPCLLSRSSTHRKPMEGQAGSVEGVCGGSVGGALGWSSRAHG